MRGRRPRIAILALGGGFHASDLKAYFRSLHLRPPEVRTISVMGARNRPLEKRRLRRFMVDLNNPALSLNDLMRRHPADFEQGLDTVETTMDVEIAGALAPEAALDVYFAPNTPEGWYTALYAALGEPGALKRTELRRRPGAQRRPEVISISWGASESHWTANHMLALEGALELAKHLGVSVCCASGDFGSRVDPPGRSLESARVSFPASSSLALACGGTALEANGAQVLEIAWNNTWRGQRVATGGGISGLFEKPSYQRRARVPAPGSGAVWRSRRVADGGARSFRGRGVPDVAANADAATGCRILVGGTQTAASGTSAATPLWAALLARLNGHLKAPAGWINPCLYRPELRHAFRPITRGDNDVTGGALRFFRARPGWNACTGLGAPDGQRLLALLRGRG